MKTALASLLVILSYTLHAQNLNSRHKINIGLGVGMDYGGLGGRVTYLPIERLGLFACAGYNLNGVGYNAGAQFLFPKNRHAFYLTAMYGYNAVLVMTGDSNDGGIYYGVTAGVGYLFKIGSRGNFWNFELLVPFRNSNFYDDYDALNSMGTNMSAALPVGFSVGYHFSVR
ncbi:hypothetical protein WBG78_23870 [Chryseolinea sp. T2]|uniref:hypothetical protein n=1 Tax=Chryseolinea sp. T2 TaxID=3129255 RepID=UPI003077DC8A